LFSQSAKKSFQLEGKGTSLLLCFSLIPSLINVQVSLYWSNVTSVQSNLSPTICMWWTNRSA